MKLEYPLSLDYTVQVEEWYVGVGDIVQKGKKLTQVRVIEPS